MEGVECGEDRLSYCHMNVSSSWDDEKQGDTWYLKIIGQHVSYLFMKVLDANIVVIISFTKVEKSNTPAEGMVKYRKIFSRKFYSAVNHSRVRLIYRKNGAHGFGYFNTHVIPTYSTCWRLIIPTLLYNYVVQTVLKQAVLSLKWAPCFGPAENTKCLWAILVTTRWGQL